MKRPFAAVMAAALAFTLTASAREYVEKPPPQESQSVVRHEEKQIVVAQTPPWQEPVPEIAPAQPAVRVAAQGGGPAPGGIPKTALLAYQAAADSLAKSKPGCGLHWSLLAGIGRAESNHGRYGGSRLSDDGRSQPAIRGIALDGRPGVAVIGDSDRGILDGDTVFDRAVGPMQFIPSTWRRYAADGNRDGRADPDNVFDAALAAGRYLCAGGGDLRKDDQLAAAIHRYNHSDEYVRVVTALARAYREGHAPVVTEPKPAPPVLAAPAPAPPPSSVAPTSSSVPASSGAPKPDKDCDRHWEPLGSVPSRKPSSSAPETTASVKPERDRCPERHKPSVGKPSASVNPTSASPAPIT